MNQAQTQKKLQHALASKGFIYNVEMEQWYSEKKQRYVTHYHIMTTEEVIDKKTGKKKRKKVELYDSFSRIDIMPGCPSICNLIQRCFTSNRAT